MMRRLHFDMTKLFLDVLDPKRQACFRRLKPFAQEWVLAGGTALALQIRHRQSFDFDLFSSQPIPQRFYSVVSGIVGESPKKLVDSQDQLTLALSSGIELTFLHYWYPAQYSSIPTESVPLADIHDIAADKAAALGRRNVWRDYVDLYILLKDRHLTLPEIIGVAQKKFGNEFSETLFLQQLSYTDDIRDEAVSMISRSVAVSDIRSFLEQEALSYAKDATLS